MQTINEEMHELIQKLNYYTLKYDEGSPEISDKEWDDMYFTLLDLENQAGFYYDDSPTRKVNYEVKNELQKVEHNHKMLSLDKTKDLTDIVNFANGNPILAMSKLDGLTCSIKYHNGKLISAETRGNGLVGEDVLHNILTLPTVPHRINYSDDLIIDGEIICPYDNFEEFSKEYSNPRNFAAGSIRLLDSQECSKRHLMFVAWDVIQGFEGQKFLSQKLQLLKKLGFSIVPRMIIFTIDENVVDVIKALSNKSAYPIDGVVFKFDDIDYGKQLGETAHHFKNAIAYKFYDELYQTYLQNIEWSMGRTGVLTPIAVFNPVEADGSIIERASLHNITVANETLGNPYKNEVIWVSKRNMIIPQVEKAKKKTVSSYEEEEWFSLPKECPICGGLTKIITSVSGVDNLVCANPNCDGKLINKLDHFCGKIGLDIKGLSKATLEKLIDWGWIESIVDIFSLSNFENEWKKKPGFGEKSVNNILNAIAASKSCDLDAFICSLGIPLIGRTVAKDLALYFKTWDNFRQAVINNFDFVKLDGFAENKSKAINDFDYTNADYLIDNNIIVINEKLEENITDSKILNKKFVITGTLHHFKNRIELQAKIESLGGKVVSSVSKNVDYLINNNINSTSSKNVAAKKLGIPILSEEEFLEVLT